MTIMTIEIFLVVAMHSADMDDTFSYGPINGMFAIATLQLSIEFLEYAAAHFIPQLFCCL